MIFYIQFNKINFNPTWFDIDIITIDLTGKTTEASSSLSQQPDDFTHQCNYYLALLQLLKLCFILFIFNYHYSKSCEFASNNSKKQTCHWSTKPELPQHKRPRFLWAGSEASNVGGIRIHFQSYKERSATRGQTIYMSPYTIGNAGNRKRPAPSAVSFVYSFLNTVLIIINIQICICRDHLQEKFEFVDPTDNTPRTSHHPLHRTNSTRSSSSMSTTNNSPSFFEDTTSAFNDPYSTPFVKSNKRKRDMQVCFSGEDGAESPIFWTVSGTDQDGVSFLTLPYFWYIMWVEFWRILTYVSSQPNSLFYSFLHTYTYRFWIHKM